MLTAGLKAHCFLVGRSDHTLLIRLYELRQLPSPDFKLEARSKTARQSASLTQHTLTFWTRGNYSATSNNMKLVQWPLMGMGGLLHLVQRGGDWVGVPSSLYQV